MSMRGMEQVGAKAANPGRGLRFTRSRGSLTLSKYTFLTAVLKSNSLDC